MKILGWVLAIAGLVWLYMAYTGGSMVSMIIALVVAVVGFWLALKKPTM